MALTKKQKEALEASYEAGLAKAPHAFLVGFSGLTVPQDTELRVKVREIGGSYQVVKNTLALRAVGGEALEGLADRFSGPTAVAYSSEDAVSLAKALTQFAKDVPAIEFKGGLVNNQLVEPEQIKDIAELPSREELLAKLLYLLQSPIVGLARVLNAVTRDFVVVLDQVRQQKDSQS